MNEWKEIWTAYFEEAKKRKILLSTWEKASKWEKLYILLMLIFLFLSFIPFWFGVNAAIYAAIVIEAALIFTLSEIKEGMLTTEYGDTSDAKIPPEKENQQSTRYLVFRDALLKKHINKSHVLQCFDLIDCQIDIASTSNNATSAKFIPFLVGLLSGLILIQSRSLQPKEAIFFTIFIIITIVLCYTITTLFPSKVERLKELKYFMLLFSKENQ